MGNAERPARKGQRTTIGRMANAALRSATPDFVRQRLMGTLDVTVAAQHLTYVELEMLGLLDTPDIKPVETFYVVRDPFDRALSSVTHFMGKQANPQAFEKSLATWLDRDARDHNDRAHRRPQFHFVTNRRGEMITGQHLRFETLGADFATFAKERDIKDITLPWRGRHAEAKDARDIYTPVSRKLVEQAFSEDFDAFGYAF